MHVLMKLIGGILASTPFWAPFIMVAMVDGLSVAVLVSGTAFLLVSLTSVGFWLLGR